MELDRAQDFFSENKIQYKDIHLSTEAELNDHWNGKTRAEFHIMIYNGEVSNAKNSLETTQLTLFPVDRHR